MEFKRVKLIKELEDRKAYCNAAISKYNKKLPKKFLIALGISLLYAGFRMVINSSEKISFLTTLAAIFSFFMVIILVNHKILLNKIKKDIRELNSQIKALQETTLVESDY